MGENTSPLGEDFSKLYMDGMRDYRRTSHTMYDIKYHIVWITKYRKPVLYGKEAEKLRDLIREICSNMNIEIIKGNIRRDHIHMFVSVPPHISVSKVMQAIKDKTSYKMMAISEKFRKLFWGKHLWARGYFVASSGNVTDEIIAQYMENQDEIENSRDDDFKMVMD